MNGLFESGGPNVDQALSQLDRGRFHDGGSATEEGDGGDGGEGDPSWLVDPPRASSPRHLSAVPSLPPLVSPSLSLSRFFPFRQKKKRERSKEQGAMRGLFY